MSDALIGLIGSVIVGALTLLGVIYQSHKNNDALFAKLDKNSELADARLDAKLDKYQAVTDNKIEELTREVRLHNSYVTRVPILEEKVSSLERKIS